MPVSDFVPLVGSGFDALANQRMGWEQFNANIENQNLARAERAQQQQDNWLAQVAAMNEQRDQQNFDRQLQADAYGRQLNLQNQQEATRQRERAEDTSRAAKQFQQQMDYGKNYLDQQQKIAEEKITASEKNKELVLDSQGQHLAANYQGLQNTQEQTSKVLEDLRSKIDDVGSQLETERAKKKPDPAKIISLQNTQKLYNGQLRQRESDARSAENKLSALLNHAENAGFEINDDGTITHKESDKTWNWKNALKQAKQNIANPNPLIAAAQSDTTGNPVVEPWAGFNANSSLPVSVPAPVSSPMGTNSFSVGRFTVTPQ